MADRNLRIRMLLEASDKVTRPLRDMAGGSTKAAQALRATRDRLKEIERAQADVGGFRQLKAGLRSTETELQTARTKVGQLAQQMNQAGAPTRQLTRDFAKAKQEAQALKDRHAQEARQLQQLRDRLNAANISTRDLARHERDLRDQAGRTTRELEQQSRRLELLQQRQQRMAAGREGFDRVNGRAASLAAGGAAAIGTGVVMAAPIIAAGKEAMEFESRMTDIAQKADMSRAAAAGMGHELLGAAKAANQLPQAIQEGVDTLAGFGLAVPDAQQMVTPIGRAATAYKAEMADLAAAAFAAKDNLKVPIDQTAKVIDVMASAGKAGAFEIKDMAQYFPTLTAAYQGYGQKGVGAVADLSAALQITRKGAGDAASAATNLQNVLQKLASPDTVRAFKKNYNVDLPAALKKAYAEGKTPIEALAEITNRTLKGDLSKLSTLYSDAQVQQGLRPLIQNMDEYRRIRKEAGAANGVTDTDFIERMNDSAEKAKALEIRAKTLSVVMGEQLKPVFDPLADKARELADRFAGWAEKNPTLVRGLALAAIGMAGLFVVLGGGAIVIAGLLAPFAALSFAAGALELALLPTIGIAVAIIAGLALLGVAGYALWSKWDEIGAYFSGLWQRISDGFSGAVAAIGAKISEWTALGGHLIQGVIDGITGKLAALKSTVVGAAGAAAGWFKERLGIHSPSRVFMGFGGFMMEGLSEGIDAGTDGPTQRIGDLSRKLTDQMSGAGNQQRLGGLSRQIGAALAIGAAVPAVAAPSGAAGAGGAGGATAPTSRVFNITINQQAGQSAQDLAKMVADEIDRRERQQGAAQRSSYADTPDWD